MVPAELEPGEDEPSRFSAGEGVGRNPAFHRALPEQRDHLANLTRLLVMVRLGVLLWPSFLLMDWLMASLVYPQPFWLPAVVRLGTTPLPLILMVLLQRSPPPSPRALALYELTVFVSASASLGVLAALFGGLSGPYPEGLFLILVCRAAFVVQPWRRALFPNLVVVLAHFAALLLAERWLHGGTRWDGATSSLFVLHVSSLASGAILLTLASNATWLLRRRVYAARNLGRYRLLERIGEGGHGDVWSAYHPGLKQHVAIKVLRSEVADDERAISRFELEIDALCRLKNPHTVRILDHGVTGDGVCYYAMELLEGANLAELVALEGPLECGRVVHYLLQAARALAEAHDHGIVHRDIKPENLFVLRSHSIADFVKLLDFGISRRERGQRPRTPSVTGTGMVVGTPAFMAPEVAHGEIATYRADVYGIGAVGYFAFTGEPPRQRGELSGSTSSELASRLSARLAHVPIDVRHVLIRCLSTDPQARYAHASELAAHLEALAEAHGHRPGPFAHSAAPTMDVPRRGGPASE